MFFERLKELCKNKGTTPTAIARELTNSSSNVTSWRTGTKPNGDTLEKIADYFNVSVDYLLGKTDDPTPVDEMAKYKEGYLLYQRLKEAGIVPDSLNGENVDTFLKELDELREDAKKYPSSE